MTDTRETMQTGILVAGLLCQHVNKLTANDNYAALVALVYATCLQSLTTTRPGTSPSDMKSALMDVVSQTYDSVHRAHEKVK